AKGTAIPTRLKIAIHAKVRPKIRAWLSTSSVGSLRCLNPPRWASVLQWTGSWVIQPCGPLLKCAFTRLSIAEHAQLRKLKTSEDENGLASRIARMAKHSAAPLRESEIRCVARAGQAAIADRPEPKAWR